MVRAIRKGLLKGLVGLALIGASASLGGCFKTGPSYNPNASYWSHENAAERSYHVNETTLGILGTPRPRSEIPGTQPVSSVTLPGQVTSAPNKTYPAFAYTSYEDANRNSNIEINEFRGIETPWRVGELRFLALYTAGSTEGNSTVIARIYNSKGNLEGTRIITQDITRAVPMFSSIGGEFNLGEQGRVDWEVNGRPAGSMPLRIFPAN